MKPLTLQVLPRPFAISRLPADAETPEWAQGDAIFIARTEQELSVLCEQRFVPGDVVAERGWRCLGVAGKLDFSMTGVLAGLTAALNKVPISLLATSTFDTDYLFVRDADLESAMRALRSAGHRCVMLDASVGDSSH